MPWGGIIVGEIDKCMVSFFFDSKNFKLKISMKLEKIRILILQFDIGNCFVPDASFSPAALTKKD